MWREDLFNSFCHFLGQWMMVAVFGIQFMAIKMPVCHHCGEVARPNILMFGDYGWLSDIAQAKQQHFSRWFEQSFCSL